jgi:hypothetical protein
VSFFNLQGEQLVSKQIGRHFNGNFTAGGHQHIEGKHHRASFQLKVAHIRVEAALYFLIGYKLFFCQYRFVFIKICALYFVFCTLCFAAVNLL